MSLLLPFHFCFPILIQTCIHIKHTESFTSMSQCIWLVMCAKKVIIKCWDHLCDKDGSLKEQKSPYLSFIPILLLYFVQSPPRHLYLHVHMIVGLHLYNKSLARIVWYVFFEIFIELKFKRVIDMVHVSLWMFVLLFFLTFQIPISYLLSNLHLIFILQYRHIWIMYKYFISLVRW